MLGACTPSDPWPAPGPDRDGDQVADEDDPCPDDPTDRLDEDGRCADAPAADLALPGPRAVLQRWGGTCAATVEGRLLVPGFDAAALEVWDGSGRIDAVRVDLDPQGAFAATVELPAGLVSYELRVRGFRGAVVFAVVSRPDLLCGDHLLVHGQSNAVAADYHDEGLANTWQSPWIRSFGTTSEQDVASDLSWGDADGEALGAHAAVGAWALRMAARLVEDQGVPVALLNGAVGGTSIALHTRSDDDPEDLDTLYGRLLFRARRAGMAEGARALLWYQGESDGGEASADGPGSYLERFGALRDAWHEDFPALEKIYVFQVRDGCGVDPSRDGALELTFADAAGLVLETHVLPVWAGEAWAASHLHAVPPPGATTATATLRGDGQGALRFDDAWLGVDGEASLLVNGDFESAEPFPLVGWISRGSGESRWEAGDAHGGGYAARLEGATGEQRLSQTVTVVPGLPCVLGAWIRAERADPDVREVQRTLPDHFDEVVLMSTTAVPGHDGCHFRTEGYEALGLAISRLVARDLYGSTAVDDIAPPAVLRAERTAPDEVLLTFQPLDGRLVLAEGLEDFVLAGTQVVSAVVDGDALRLRLGEPTDAEEISYLGDAAEGPGVTTGLGVGLLSFFGLPIDP